MGLFKLLKRFLKGEQDTTTEGGVPQKGQVPSVEFESETTTETGFLKEKLSVNIGLDFGTHGTKVVVKEGDSDFRDFRIVVLADECIADRAPGVYPSLVGMQDNLIFFGNNAKSCEKCFHNFKILEKRRNNHELPLSDPELSILFVAYVYLSTKNVLIKNHPEMELSFTLNLGTPKALIDENATEYEEIVNRAWTIAEKYENVIFQGISLNEAKELLLESQNHTTPLGKYCFLVPELSGALTTYRYERPVDLHGEHHIVIDIGGYTTDVAFFNTGSDKPSVYSTGVIKQAGLAFEEALKNGNEESVVRSIQSEINQIIDSTCKEERETSRTAQRWWIRVTNDTQHKLRLIGGGARNNWFTNLLLNRDSFLAQWKIEVLGSGEISVPKIIAPPEYKQLPTTDDVFSFFTVARGLADTYRNIAEIKPLGHCPEDTEHVETDYSLNEGH